MKWIWICLLAAGMAYGQLSYDDLAKIAKDPHDPKAFEQQLLDYGLDFPVTASLLRKMAKDGFPDWMIDTIMDYDQNRLVSRHYAEIVDHDGYSEDIHHHHGLNYHNCEFDFPLSYLGWPYHIWSYCAPWYYWQWQYHYGYNRPWGPFDYWPWIAHRGAPFPHRGTRVGTARPRHAVPGTRSTRSGSANGSTVSNRVMTGRHSSATSPAGSRSNTGSRVTATRGSSQSTATRATRSSSSNSSSSRSHSSGSAKRRD